MKGGETVVDYSTRFYCPRCKAETGKIQMLYIDCEKEVLRCENHPSYTTYCNCDKELARVVQEKRERKERAKKFSQEREEEKIEAIALTTLALGEVAEKKSLKKNV